MVIPLVIFVPTVCRIRFVENRKWDSKNQFFNFFGAAYQPDI